MIRKNNKHDVNRCRNEKNKTCATVLKTLKYNKFETYYTLKSYLKFVLRIIFESGAFLEKLDLL